MRKKKNRERKILNKKRYEEKTRKYAKPCACLDTSFEARGEGIDTARDDAIDTDTAAACSSLRPIPCEIINVLNLK